MGAVESSAYGTYSASKLIDGTGLDGTWSSGGCAATQGGGLEWFSLELETPITVTRVQIANRVDCCIERGRNVLITIGPSQVYDPNEPLCLPEIPELEYQPGLKDYVCTTLHEGKHVKISRPGWLNLCEVKVFTLRGNC